MALLNEKNSITEKIVHIMITDKCNRKCPHCCNNQYDIYSIPVVTDEELKRAEYVFLTGGACIFFVGSNHSRLPTSIDYGMWKANFYMKPSENV